MFQLVFYSAPSPSPPSNLSRICYTLFLIMLITNSHESSWIQSIVKNEVIHKPLKTTAFSSDSSQDLLKKNILYRIIYMQWLQKLTYQNCHCISHQRSWKSPVSPHSLLDSLEEKNKKHISESQVINHSIKKVNRKVQQRKGRTPKHSLVKRNGREQGKSVCQIYRGEENLDMVKRKNILRHRHLVQISLMQIDTEMLNRTFQEFSRNGY